MAALQVGYDFVAREDPTARPRRQGGLAGVKPEMSAIGDLSLKLQNPGQAQSCVPKHTLESWSTRLLHAGSSPRGNSEGYLIASGFGGCMRTVPPMALLFSTRRFDR